MERGESRFKTLIIFLNEKNIGDSFSRSEMLKSAKAYGTRHQQVFDGYIGCLVNKNYLKRLSRGTYEILNKLPEDLVINNINK